MSARERIALVTSSYPSEPGDASGHFVEAEARALAADGHDVTVFAAGEPREVAGPPRVIWLADGGAAGFPGLKARLRAMPLRWFGLALWLVRVRIELAARGPFERIVVHWLVPGALPLLAIDTGATRLEVVVHGSDARLLATLPRPLARSLLGALLARDARFRCVSQELLKLVETLANRSLGDRAYVAPARIDVSGAPHREDARRALGIGAGARLGVIVARLVAEKRVDVALRAALGIEGLELTVIGDGPERLTLTRDFPTVRFTGQLARPDALTWIAAADVLLSASRREGAPSVVREARALGVPVVACAAGDLATWAADDPGLFVVP